jgi:8-oxo-dGTP pyrophosphatase MutT (NUDIX family)
VIPLATIRVAGESTRVIHAIFVPATHCQEHPTEMEPSYPLAPAPAVGALITTPDGRYLLQHRDDLPQIWYPNHWGLFGGGIEAGESPEDALRRELMEEIGFAPAELRYFTQLDFHFGFAGGPEMPRLYYEVPVTDDDVGTMRLGEGQAMRLFSQKELAETVALVGYDYFAIYLHIHRARITAGITGQSSLA